MSHWQANSALCRYGEAAAGNWIRLRPDFAHVIDAGLRISASSDGAFDPAIGRLTSIWGIGPEPVSDPPSPDRIAAALHRSGAGRLAWDSAASLLYQPGGLALDLSGIAKGHTVDVVADLLRAKGIEHCLVEVGGELVGRGIRPDLDPWWVDLETPPETGLTPIRIALHELAVASSGNYVRGPHTIDPRTGTLVDNDVVAVSVCHPKAMIADAWATALTVLGPDPGLETATREALAARWILRDGDGFREVLTPALEAML
jgi:thiamine biosynthesis lipoprotein